MPFDIKKDLKKIEKKNRKEAKIESFRTALKKAGLKKRRRYYRNLCLCITIVIFALLVSLIYYYDRGDKEIFFFSFLALMFFAVKYSVDFLFRAMVDYMKFLRTKAIEKHLPGFLQLTSTNLSAGMNLEESMLYASRKEFGLLSKEIETIAKKSMSGHSIDESFNDFAERYDSKLLTRSVCLITESIRTGGRVSEILDKISEDISERNIIKKDLSANVTSYVIFISFASLLASPFLYALGHQLITVLNRIKENIQIPDNTLSTLLSNQNTIDLTYYTFFSVICIVSTAVISALLVNVIKKGSVKEDIFNVPIYILVSLCAFFMLKAALSYFFGIMFSY